MNQNNKPISQVQQQAGTVPAQKKPNETGSISVEGFVRIFDPNTKEKFVEKRA